MADSQATGTDDRRCEAATFAPGRPRVALVAHGIHDGGGMESACAELIRHAHGDVRFVAVTAELAPDLLPLVEHWEKVRVPMRPAPLRFVTFFLRAAVAVRRSRADVVHTVGAIVPNRIDVAGVHFCHAGHLAATGSLGPHTAPPLRRLNTALLRWLALIAERWCYRPGRVRALAAVSSDVGRQLERHYPGIRLATTPNGIDPQRFRPDPHGRRVVRDAHRAGDACVALFVGGDWDHKGLGLAIEALAKARAEGHEVVLWIVGPGDQRRFGALARACGAEDHVAFFGVRSDTERLYQAADLFVLPSAYETFSIVCFEAAASGLPLVIPRIGGAGELVGDDEAGLIVGRNVDEVAAAMSALARDTARRTALGSEACRRARRFTWTASGASVIHLYRSLLGEEAGS